MKKFKEYMHTDNLNEGRKFKWREEPFDISGVSSDPVFSLVTEEDSRKTYLGTLEDKKDAKKIEEAAKLIKDFIDAAYEASVDGAGSPE